MIRCQLSAQLTFIIYGVRYSITSKSIIRLDTLMKDYVHENSIAVLCSQFSQLIFYFTHMLLEISGLELLIYYFLCIIFFNNTRKSIYFCRSSDLQKTNNVICWNIFWDISKIISCIEWSVFSILNCVNFLIILCYEHWKFEIKDWNVEDYKTYIRNVRQKQREMYLAFYSIC